MNLATSKEVPFLLTILIAALAWVINHSVDRLLESNAIEYDISEVSVAKELLSLDNTLEYGNLKAIKVEFNNLTRDHTFTDFQINFALKDSLDEYKLYYIVKDFSGLINPFKNALKSNRINYRSHNSTIEEFHPRHSLAIIIYYTGQNVPSIQISSADENKTVESIRFMEPSMLTLILKYENHLFAFLTGFFVLVIFVYVYSIHKSRTQNE